MEAWYDTANPYHYDWGYWDSTAETSYNYQTPTWEIYQYPSCDYMINQYGYYAGTEFYDTSSPYWNSWGSLTVECYYPKATDRIIQRFLVLMPISLNGQSYAAFYQISNSNNMQYVSAGPTGSYYYVMTASAGPPTVHQGSGK